MASRIELRLQQREVLVQRNYNQRGATLIEVVVVAFIVMVALATLANLTVISLGRNRQAKELAVSTRLAQEGLEWFKAQRNTLGYDQFSTLATAIEGDGWCLVSESLGLNGGLSQKVAPQTDSACVVNTNYHRWFSVDVNVTYVGVTSYVSAPGDTSADAIKVEGKLYKWQR